MKTLTIQFQLLMSVCLFMSMHHTQANMLWRLFPNAINNSRKLAMPSGSWRQPGPYANNYLPLSQQLLRFFSSVPDSDPPVFSLKQDYSQEVENFDLELTAKSFWNLWRDSLGQTPQYHQHHLNDFGIAEQVIDSRAILDRAHKELLDSTKEHHEATLGLSWSCQVSALHYLSMLHNPNWKQCSDTLTILLMRNLLAPNKIGSSINPELLNYRLHHLLPYSEEVYKQSFEYHNFNLGPLDERSMDEKAYGIKLFHSNKKTDQFLRSIQELLKLNMAHDLKLSLKAERDSKKQYKLILADPVQAFEKVMEVLKQQKTPIGVLFYKGNPSLRDLYTYTARYLVFFEWNEELNKFDLKKKANTYTQFTTPKVPVVMPDGQVELKQGVETQSEVVKMDNQEFLEQMKKLTSDQQEDNNEPYPIIIPLAEELEPERPAFFIHMQVPSLIQFTYNMIPQNFIAQYKLDLPDFDPVEHSFNEFKRIMNESQSDNANSPHDFYIAELRRYKPGLYYQYLLAFYSAFENLLKLERDAELDIETASTRVMPLIRNYLAILKSQIILFPMQAENLIFLQPEILNKADEKLEDILFTLQQPLKQNRHENPEQEIQRSLEEFIAILKELIADVKSSAKKVIRLWEMNSHEQDPINKTIPIPFQ